MMTPVRKSVVAMIVTFIASAYLLLLMKPELVMHTKLDGSRSIRRDKITLLSALFSIIVAIIVLNFSTKSNPVKEGLSMHQYNMNGGCGRTGAPKSSYKMEDWMMEAM